MALDVYATAVMSGKCLYNIAVSATKYKRLITKIMYESFTGGHMRLAFLCCTGVTYDVF
jgi:transposase